MIATILVDRRNIDTTLSEVVEAVSKVQFCGLDVETQDDNRHQGLNLLMKVNEETRKKAGNTRLYFDHRRTVMTGFSIYPEGHDKAYYFNLGHADVENRITFDEVRCVFDALPANGFWLSHNAPFEITMFQACHGYALPNIICTMQLSVTAFGDDNYDIQEWKASGLLGLDKWPVPLYAAAQKHEATLAPEEDEEEEVDDKIRRFGRGVEEIIQKICSKTSDAAHSYNGYVDELAYGHGLKQLVKTFFGYQMGTFKETLGENAHMGQLTGDQVRDYGAEDAYWVVPLFRVLLTHVAQNSPDALETFITQENPMVQIYSELWQGGMRVNRQAIEDRRVIERENFATALRKLRAAIRTLVWSEERNEELARRQDWYDKNWQTYRARIQEWANMPDEPDDFEEAMRVSNAVSNAWAEERGDKRKGPLSITHYMPARVMLYDLLGSKLMFDAGKLASNGEARGKIKTWLEKNSNNPAKLEVIDLITELASIEQRMKLYLTPYNLLADPETNRLYPQVNSLLNTRRMAASQPNPMQLAKRGESTYVRGFFVGDTDDEVVVSIDWSAIELVIIGELSKDPEFKVAFGQLPHEDLHTGATVSVLGVEMPWLEEQHFKALKQTSAWGDFYDTFDLHPDDCTRLITNLKGETIESPSKARGYWRTEVGKGANFNYWFSGWLHTIGQRMGWNMNTTGEAVARYRERFATAEQWRIDLIQHGQINGWAQLPDGHRRFRYEATYDFMEWFKAKWPVDPLLDPIVHEIARRISKRGQNQLVNAVVQGTCATIAKRSALRIREAMKGMRARFMIPIHDELVFSVHWQEVPEFIALARGIMLDHPDIFPTLKLDASPAVGMTFEPWNPVKAPLGQVELFEPPAEIVGVERAGKRLDDDGIREVVDYLRRGKMKLAA